MRASLNVNSPLLAVLAAIVIVGLLAGCGGDNDASPTPTEPPPSASPSGLPTSPASLSSALLTVADLPNGWQPGGSETFGPGTTFCGLALPSELEPQETASGAFSNTMNGFVFAQHLLRYEPGEAAKILVEYRKAIEPCEEWTVPAPDGSEAHYAVSVLEIDGITGGDTFGFKVTMQVNVEVSPIANQSAHLEMHVVLTRFGDLVNWLTYGGLPREGLPVEEAEDFARRAASKLEGFEGS
jgi:hypothetical protein